MTLSLDQTEAALAGGVVAFESERDTIEVVGPDAASYLQGQISQDVQGLGVGASAWSFVLAPQGKVDGWFRVTRIAEEHFLLDLDAGHGADILKRLERFKLRTKATLTSATRRLVALRGLASPGEDVSGLGGLALPVVWPGIVGVDLLDPTTDPTVEFGDRSAFEAQRIRAGLPALGAELDEHTIPAESGVVDVSVSFTKGCYVGQELVARVDSRGNNTPRNLVGLRLAGTEVPAIGSEVRTAEGPVGRLTSAALTSCDGVVALLYAKRGTPPDAPVQVELPSGGHAEGQLTALPF